MSVGERVVAWSRAVASVVARALGAPFRIRQDPLTARMEVGEWDGEDSRTIQDLRPGRGWGWACRPWRVADQGGAGPGGSGVLCSPGPFLRPSVPPPTAPGTTALPLHTGRRSAACLSRAPPVPSVLVASAAAGADQPRTPVRVPLPKSWVLVFSPCLPAVGVEVGTRPSAPAFAAGTV